MKRIGAVTSWISIILRALRSDNELTRQRLNGFLIKVIPWITSQHFVVRVLSLSSIKMLCSWHRQTILNDPSNRFAIAVADFDVDVVGNSRKLVASMCAETLFEQMLAEHIDLKLVFYGMPKVAGLPKDELIFEEKPNGLLLKELTDYAAYDYDQPSVFSSKAFIKIFT